MAETLRKNYFVVIKFLLLLLLFLFYITNSEDSLQQIGMGAFLLAVSLAISVTYELVDRHKSFFLCLELVSGVVLIWWYPLYGLLLVPIFLLDYVTCRNKKPGFYILGFLGVIFYKGDILFYIIFTSFITIIYFQNYEIIEKHKKYIRDYEEQESKLKDSIDTKDLLFRKELAQNSLYFEHQMLEEKTRLSQALHDKLGHSINGSVYQLEACKLLTTKDPNESVKIMQAVIDNLRSSMDEIRMILRKEKPDKKRMALIQLEGLCEECRNKYQIQAELILDSNQIQVPELIWEIILDNTFEAVSNALKYARCKKITIHILVFPKLVRCSILDDGIGCEVIKEGMGIQGMKQRARKTGGIIDVESTMGFAINMILPF